MIDKNFYLDISKLSNTSQLGNTSIMHISYFQNLITAIILVITIFFAIKFFKKYLRERKMCKNSKTINIIKNKK